MLHNRSLRFRCETVRLRVENSRTPFTNRYAESQVIRIPINHGISNYFCDEATLERLKRRGDAVFLLDETKAELGGSEFQKVVNGVVGGQSLRVVVNGRTVVDAPVEQLARIW